MTYAPVLKRAATLLLLAFVATGIAVMAARRLSPSAGMPALPDGLVLYYFHGPERCPTCARLEAACREAVLRVSAELDGPLSAPPMRMESVNFLAPENEWLRERFDVGALSVVLAEVTGGRVSRWEMLHEMWEHVGDAAALTDHIAGRLHEFAKGR